MISARVRRSVGAAIIDRCDAVTSPIPLRRRFGERVDGGGPGVDPGVRLASHPIGRVTGRLLHNVLPAYQAGGAPDGDLVGAVT